MNKIPVYSPTQVRVAAFFGGPFATVYTLWKNFHALDNAASANKTLVWGAVFVVALFIAMPVLPDGFPNVAIPVAYMLAAGGIAEKFQMPKQAIQESDRYEFRSAGNVVVVCLVCFVLFATAAVAWLFALASTGWINLD